MSRFYLFVFFENVFISSIYRNRGIRWKKGFFICSISSNFTLNIFIFISNKQADIVDCVALSLSILPHNFTLYIYFCIVFLLLLYEWSTKLLGSGLFFIESCVYDGGSVLTVLITEPFLWNAYCGSCYGNSNNKTFIKIKPWTKKVFLNETWTKVGTGSLIKGLFLRK